MRQCDAARMIYRLKPKCPIGCREAIERMLPKWDNSLEEVVFYLVEQFGAEKMRATLGELKGEKTDEQGLRDISVVDYWVGCFEDMKKEREGR
jgi:hypothetical protein